MFLLQLYQRCQSFSPFEILFLEEKIVVILQTITTSIQHLWVLVKLPGVFQEFS